MGLGLRLRADIRSEWIVWPLGAFLDHSRTQNMQYKIKNRPKTQNLGKKVPKYAQAVPGKAPIRTQNGPRI